MAAHGVDATLGMSLLAGIVLSAGLPLIGAIAGLGAASLLGLSAGGVALFMVLSASASYFAVPAAMRVALP